ncbi:MAG: hypothetical protein IKK13_01835 [Clostridia bacterium]|nr:hypothetical protein [Clostridia bacterium]
MFFKTQETIPEGLGFSAFDLTHLLWLAAIISGCAVACWFYRKMNSKSRNIMLKIVGAAVVFEEIIKNIAVIAVGEFGYGYLPFHLCGINILLIAFDILRPTKLVRSFLYSCQSRVRHWRFFFRIGPRCRFGTSSISTAL